MIFLLILNLDNNQLTKITIGAFTHLTDLRLDYNMLTYIPPEIGMLTSLINLKLNHNMLKYIPREIYKLVKLKTLDISMNQLKFIPYLASNVEPFKKAPTEKIYNAEHNKNIICWQNDRITNYDI